MELLQVGIENKAAFSSKALETRSKLFLRLHWLTAGLPTVERPASMVISELLHLFPTISHTASTTPRVLASNYNNP